MTSKITETGVKSNKRWSIAQQCHVNIKKLKIGSCI